MKEYFMSNESSLPFRSEAHYRLLRAKLVAFFDRRRCTSSEDQADETLARLIKLADAREVGNPDAAAFGIAKYVFLEWLRLSGRFTALDDEPACELTPGSRRFRSIAETSIQALSPADRDFLEEYFIDGKKAGELASQLGTTPVAVRGRVFRLRRSLQFAVGQMLAGGAPAPDFSRPSAA
jgi:DNA-directed RNA polymerase specialized sigma24 family protein